MHAIKSLLPTVNSVQIYSKPNYPSNYSTINVYLDYYYQSKIMKICNNESKFMNCINGNINNSISKNWILPKRSIIANASFTTFMLIITLTNIQCIYKIGRSLRKYKSNNFYSIARLLIILLAIVNTWFLILILLIVVPSQLAGFWIGGIYTCNIVGSLIEIWTNFVTLIATVISLERYVAIKKPFRYNYLCSPWKMKLLLLLIFIASILTGIISLSLNKFALISCIPICQIFIDHRHEINSLEYITSWLDLSCFIPCSGILLLTTLAVLLELKRMSIRVRSIFVMQPSLLQSSRSGDLRQTEKLARIVIIITLWHLLCWIPQRVCSFIQRLGNIDDSCFIFYGYISFITKLLDMLVVPLAIFWSHHRWTGYRYRSRTGKSLP
ncbi:hypothetical protein TrispH2_004139 [Trichoplax sp. H2]|nr:hypothetical protein TrispH2_004139 [Trichoplax sp. H2]|eukprot:RDD43465.1 hypothetical protein TrispH2_004139 [Trichoplax sp. H2]